MDIIHRGIVSRQFKENCLRSFRESFKRGYGVETDIHLTKDKKFICYHDFTLKRLFKINKSIKNLNFNFIKSKMQNKIYAPELKEVLKLSKKKFKVFIEIKPLMNTKILKKLIKETKNFKNCIFISFKEKNISRLYKINKKIKLGLSFSKYSSIGNIEKRSKVINVDYLILDKYFLNSKKIFKINKIKFFYTIKSKKKLTSLDNKQNFILENL